MSKGLMIRLLLMLVFVSGSLWAKTCEISDVLQVIRPKAVWTLRGGKYQGLQWLDAQQAKPTQAEIDAGTTQCQSDAVARQAAKAQAKLDVNNPQASPQQRINAIVILLDLDQ